MEEEKEDRYMIENELICKDQADLIQKIQNDIDKHKDAKLTKMWRKLIYIGMTSSDSVIAQYDTLWLMIKFYPILKAFIYQKAALKLYQLPRYRLNPPLPLKTLIFGALCHPESQYDSKKHIEWKRIADNIIWKLNKYKSLLSEMLSIDIEGEELISVPKIIAQIPVYLDYLPILILKLGTDVSYTSLQHEMVPFTVAKDALEVISEYYAKFIYYFKLDQDDSDLESDTNQTISYVIEHLIFPELIKSIIVPASMGSRRDTTFLTLTTTGNLYKIFERC